MERKQQEMKLAGYLALLLGRIMNSLSVRISGIGARPNNGFNMRPQYLTGYPVKYPER